MLYYVLIGFSYWLFNMYIRRLPEHNEGAIGWFLSPLWFLGWPFCILFHIVRVVLHVFEKDKDKL